MSSRIRKILGVLWLLDALLQALPAQWSGEPLAQIMATGQMMLPPLLRCPWLVDLAILHPALCTLGVVVLQALLGLCLLTGYRVRPALVASMAWAAAVWWVTGCAGVLTGTATDVGAPPLYILLALLAW